MHHASMLCPEHRSAIAEPTLRSSSSPQLHFARPLPPQLPESLALHPRDATLASPPQATTSAAGRKPRSGGVGKELSVFPRRGLTPAQPPARQPGLPAGGGSRLRARPQLLIDVLAYVERELAQRAAPAHGVSDVRLSVWREALDLFAEAFATYKPLLDAVQHEFSVHIRGLERRAHASEAEAAAAWLKQQETEGEALSEQKQLRAQIEELLSGTPAAALAALSRLELRARCDILAKAASALRAAERTDLILNMAARLPGQEQLSLTHTLTASIDAAPAAQLLARRPRAARRLPAPRPTRALARAWLAAAHTPPPPARSLARKVFMISEPDSEEVAGRTVVHTLLSMLHAAATRTGPAARWCMDPGYATLHMRIAGPAPIERAC